MVVSRTENAYLSPSEISRLKNEPTEFYCAHHNAYYMASLLMFGNITGEELYIKAGEKGLTAIMGVYPKTIREHSETQEMCRLILPLAWLYQCKKDKKYLDWLYKVTNDLQKTKHKSGAYLEWDTGYKAMRSRSQNEECSLLLNNGDPIVDLLYSVNWLPLAYMQAYLITGDKWFEKLWQEISIFFTKSQIHSKNILINGGWARGFDVELMEIYGMVLVYTWG